MNAPIALTCADIVTGAWYYPYDDGDSGQSPRAYEALRVMRANPNGWPSEDSVLLRTGYPWAPTSWFRCRKLVLSHTPADKASVKTYLDIIKELAAKRREEVKVQEQQGSIEVQLKLQERMRLWDPVLQVLREMQDGYPALMVIRNQDDPLMQLTFVVGPVDDVKKAYKLVHTKSETVPFEIRTGWPHTVIAAAATVEGLIPSVVDLLAQALTSYEK